MIDLIYISFLALVQGVTEFLPISSSAHLVLLGSDTLPENIRIYFDLILHAGSLSALIIYFHKDLFSLSKKLYINLIVATIPIVVVGAVFYKHIDIVRNTTVIAITTIVFGLLLLLSDRIKKERVEEVRLKDAIMIGLLQVLAIIPGVSRSGITLTGGLFANLTRTAAARFSFLLAIPTIGIIFLATTIDAASGGLPLLSPALVLGFFVTLAVALIVIHWFLKYIEKIGVLPFVIYRVVLGFILLIFL